MSPNKRNEPEQKRSREEKRTKEPRPVKESVVRDVAPKERKENRTERNRNEAAQMCVRVMCSSTPFIPQLLPARQPVHKTRGPPPRLRLRLALPTLPLMLPALPLLPLPAPPPEERPSSSVRVGHAAPPGSPAPEREARWRCGASGKIVSKRGGRLRCGQAIRLGRCALVAGRERRGRAGRMLRSGGMRTRRVGVVVLEVAAAGEG